MSLLSIGLACGETSITDGPLQVVPVAADSVSVLDVEQVLGGGVPDAIADDFEDSYRGAQLLNWDVDTMVLANYDEGALSILHLKNEQDFERVRNYLESDEKEQGYRGYEYWEDFWGGSAAAILEDRGYLVVGEVDTNINTVKDFLRTLDRGSGFLIDEDNDLTRILKRAGEGWLVNATQQCWLVQGCQASGEVYSSSAGEESIGIVKTAMYLFRDERTARLAKDEIEEFYAEISDVILDGEFVIISHPVDEDDYRYIPWPRS